MSQVSIILPTYNERGNILPLIDRLLHICAQNGLDGEVIVVDDNSPDGTGQAVAERFADTEQVHLVVRREERGLATAIKTGILVAEGDYVVVMDSDFNHDPAMIPQMIDFLKYYDLIIGSRFTMGGGMQNRKRYYMSFLYNFFVRIVLRTQIQDNLSGFFAVRRKQLLEMDLDEIFRGYGDYFVNFLFFAWRKGFRMLEVPVFYYARSYGESKSNFLAMLWQYTAAVLRLRLNHLALIQRPIFYLPEGHLYEQDEPIT